jgi:hypothetical protein
MFPAADQIDVEVYPKVTLIDCGENLERIVCPHCGATIAVEWWGARMEAGGRRVGARRRRCAYAVALLQ